MQISVEVSARHIHLSRQDIDVLFGPGYELKKERKLSQATDFAAREKVVLKTPKGRLELRVVGPARDYSQVEISMTDSIYYKINAELRLSGNASGAPMSEIEGPAGKTNIPVIIPKRHLHISPEEAKKIGLKQGDQCKVKIQGKRALIFENVIVRVREGYHIACHLDTDEANASGLGKVCGEGELLL